jgi:Tfp pilus assembly protein PilV
MHITVKKTWINIVSRQRRKALTLPEVVIAATLLLIALIPILKAMTQVNMNSVIIERRTQCLCLAQAKLNKIQADSTYNFASISTLNNEVLSGSYLCNTTVTTAGTLKTIKVDVGRDLNSNNILAASEIEVTLQTQIAQRW